MKVTPIEIRQKTFEKRFRGYHVDEVSAFLISLSQEWEKLIDENKELRFKFEQSDREVHRLREVENSLFKTLKTAEETGINMVEQATKSADLMMRETLLKTESLIREARNQSKELTEEAEETARSIIYDAQGEFKAINREVREIENIKENLLSELRNIISDTSDKINRYNRKQTVELSVSNTPPIKKIAENSVDLENNYKQIENSKISSFEKQIEENKHLEHSRDESVYTNLVEEDISNYNKDNFEEAESIEEKNTDGLGTKMQMSELSTLAKDINMGPLFSNNESVNIIDVKDQNKSNSENNEKESKSFFDMLD